jgi:hypothetical protein
VRDQASPNDGPGALPPGEYAFRATAFDGEGTEIAQVCRVVDLPSDETVVLELASNTCANDERDAATHGSDRDAAPTACVGASVLGLCWYLGAPGDSCVETCSARGGPDPRARSFVGTAGEGGSAEACQQILDALGYASRVMGGERDDGRGLGCHRWDNDVSWWLGRPDFDETSSMDSAQVVCACRE